MNLGAFLCVQIVSDDSGSDSLSSFSGLSRRGKWGSLTAIAMTIFLLSLTGVPPFLGFIGKFYIFSSVIESKIYWLAFAGIANSVISLYYYMLIVKTMFFSEPSNEKTVTVSGAGIKFILVLLAILTIVLGIVWQQLATLAASIM